MPCPDLTGPTNAVELVRTHYWDSIAAPASAWHVLCGEWTPCRLGLGHFAHGRESLRASRADILSGALPNVCPQCAATLEVRDET